MTKKEKIKDAYGQYWDQVKAFVNEAGWCDFRGVFGDAGNNKGLEGIDLSVMNPYDRIYCYWKIPISILRIADNQDWVKIESMDSFPSEPVFCITCIYLEGTAYQLGVTVRKRTPDDLLKMWQAAELTHYKIIDDKPPIY